jgi:uncharacterized delta-60 repeat protein
MEFLEPRLQFSSAIKYGVAASGDPSVTGVLSATGPGLKDLGAQGVRLFTDTSYLSSDFGVLPSGKIYVQNPSLVTSLKYAKEYHDAGIAVTLCIALSIDRSMVDGSLLVDKKTGQPRYLEPTELRSPKVFGTWYQTLSEAQISKSDSTSVTKVLDFWEIGNEPNHGLGAYWPVDTTQADGIDLEMDSYIDHDLIPAYNVLSKIHEPVIGAGLASGSLDQFNELNNQPGPRFHQYSDHVDYLNFHPYGIWDRPAKDLTPQAEVLDFTTAMYGDGTVTKPFVITEYNLSDYNHAFAPDPNPNPFDAAEQQGVVNDLDVARTAMLAVPAVQQHCAWIYYYRLIAQDRTTRGALFYPRPDGKNPDLPLPPLYDMFKRWAKGSLASGTAATSKGVVNLGATAGIDAIATQKDGKTLVVSDDGVRRYDTKGKLDPTYGTGGFAALPFVGKAAALQSDGALIVGGVQTDTAARPAYHLVVTRLTAAGQIDTSFATSGYFQLKNGSASQAQSIALRAGKIVIAGLNRDMNDGLLIRLDLTGQYDPTFAGGGLTIIKNSGTFSNLAITKSGAMTAMLTEDQLSPSTSIVRFTAAGALDTTFSTDGISDPQPIIGDGIFAEPDGSVLLVGHPPLLEGERIERFTPAGTLDPKFGTKGIQTIAVSGKVLRGTPIELPDGSLYLYGSIGSSLTSDQKHVFLTRLTSNGQIDSTFGSKGVMTLSSPNVQDLPFANSINSTGVLTIAAETFTQRNDLGMSQELFSIANLI